jgi:hypothetical protein
LDKIDRVCVTLNVTGTLLELFDKHGYSDLIDLLRKLGKERKVDFTGSAKYHAFLPLLPEEEVRRQILTNRETLKYFLGDACTPTGFFPPEMAVTSKLLPLIEDLGFEWILADEIAYTGGEKWPAGDRLYRASGSNLLVFFRRRRISNLIMSAVVRSRESLLKSIRGDTSSKNYVVTGMDAETFGHHRPGLEQLLFDVLQIDKINFVSVSELTSHVDKVEEFSLVDSTWASSKADIEDGIQFLSWKDPANEIHKWQWELVDLALKEVHSLDHQTPRFHEIRRRMDSALASDHLWWASAKPWWSVEMIEQGAHSIVDILNDIPNMSHEKMDRARGLYKDIVSTAFAWQRTGKIRKMARQHQDILRIPFKERTVGVGGVEKGVYDAFLHMLHSLEERSASRGEYEQAILWRDSAYKLSKKHDIYDAINVIDLVRQEIPHKEVEDIIERYKDKYRRIRGGQPEQRGS